MSPVTRRRPIARPLRWLLAPAHWLERARGRKRLALATLYSLAFAIFAAVGLWSAQLNGLPDVGEPFDVASFRTIDIPDEANAFTLYKWAGTRVERMAGESYPPRIGGTDWGMASPEVRRWVESNGEAIELWRLGADRDRAAFFRPFNNMDSSNPDTWMPDHFEAFALLLSLEASRREQAGDPAGAWAMHRAMLRSSRHLGSRGDTADRRLSREILRGAAAGVERWSRDARVDAPMLRRAAAEARACEAMTQPLSTMLKAEYARLMYEIDHPLSSTIGRLTDGSVWYRNLPGGLQTERFLRRVPERERRLARLIFANWLSCCDRPPAERRKVLFHDSGFGLYRAGDDAPASARTLAPEEIDRWFRAVDQALWGLIWLPTAERFIDDELRLLRSLRVALAERCYAREHGTPPRRLGGPYLDALPEGYWPDDVPATASKESP